MWPWLVAVVGVLGGGIATLWQRWRLQRAEDQAALWQTAAKRAAGELADLVAVGRDERQRQEAQIRVLRSDADAARAAAADLARAHPELARDFLRASMQRARGESGAPAAVAVHDPAAPDVPGQGPRGR